MGSLQTKAIQELAKRELKKRQTLASFEKAPDNTEILKQGVTLSAELNDQVKKVGANLVNTIEMNQRQTNSISSTLSSINSSLKKQADEIGKSSGVQHSENAKVHQQLSMMIDALSGAIVQSNQAIGTAINSVSKQLDNMQQITSANVVRDSSGEVIGVNYVRS